MLDSNEKHSKKGYLWKIGGFHKKWKRRYFVLHQKEGTSLGDPPMPTLSYYTSDQCTKFLGAFQVKNARVVKFPPEQAGRTGHMLGITPCIANNFDRTYVLDAESKKERNSWVATLVAAGAINGGRVNTVEQEVQNISNMENKENPLKSGMLTKLGDRVKSKKARYFTLYTDNLAYWKTNQMRNLLGRIQISSTTIVVEEQLPGEPALFCFSIQSSMDTRKYILIAKDKTERRSWMWAIKLLAQDKGRISDDTEVSCTILGKETRYENSVGRQHSFSMASPQQSYQHISYQPSFYRPKEGSVTSSSSDSLSDKEVDKDFDTLDRESESSLGNQKTRKNFPSSAVSCRDMTTMLPQFDAMLALCDGDLDRLCQYFSKFCSSKKLGKSIPN